MLHASTFVGLFAVANSTGKPPSTTRGLSFHMIMIIAMRACVVIAVACATLVLCSFYDATETPCAPKVIAWARVYQPLQVPDVIQQPVLTPPVAKKLVLAPGQEVYEGFIGHWVMVTATAYSPTDSIDSDYHATKGEWRWITADGKTDVHKEPFGVAIPRIGKKPKWPYGTKIIVPKDSGYIPWRSNRLFIADDTGSRITKNTKTYRKPYIDLRVRTPEQATAYGKRNIRVFIIDEELPGD